MSQALQRRTPSPVIHSMQMTRDGTIAVLLGLAAVVVIALLIDGVASGGDADPATQGIVTHYGLEFLFRTGFIGLHR